MALARALYGNPKLLVLDEPNSNLDASGDDALMSAIETMKKRGVTVILITHRPHAVSHMDKVLVLQNGMVQKFGPREDVLPTAPQANRHRGTPGRPDPSTSLEQAFAPQSKPAGGSPQASQAATPTQSIAKAPGQVPPPGPPGFPGQGQRLAPPPPPPTGRRVATPYLGSGAGPAAGPVAGPVPGGHPQVANTDIVPQQDTVPRPLGMPGRFGGGRGRHREPEMNQPQHQPVQPPQTGAMAPPAALGVGPQHVPSPPPPPAPPPQRVAAPPDDAAAGAAARISTGAPSSPGCSVGSAARCRSDGGTGSGTAPTAPSGAATDGRSGSEDPRSCPTSGQRRRCRVECSID